MLNNSLFYFLFVVGSILSVWHFSYRVADPGVDQYYKMV